MPFSDAYGPYDFWTANWNPVGGFYGITNANRQMIYVGQTEDLQRRMAEHRADASHCMHRYSPALVWVEVVTGGEPARLARERQLILEYTPPCNL